MMGRYGFQLAIALLIAMPVVSSAEDNMLDEVLMRVVKIEAVSKSPLSGVWTLDGFGGRCVEYYNFKDNNQVFIVSGRELTIGKFDYKTLNAQHLPNSQIVLPHLIAGLELAIIDENLQTDCGGRAIDQRNEKWQYLINELSPNSIQLCLGTTPASCVMTLNRLLP